MQKKTLNIKNTISIAAFVCSLLIFTLGTVGCEGITKIASKFKTNNQNSSVPSTTANQSVSPTTVQTPSVSKNVTNTQKKVESAEPLPHKISETAAVSPVYALNSKNGKISDDLASEGDEYYRECKTYGGYSLFITGSDDGIN